MSEEEEEEKKKKKKTKKNKKNQKKTKKYSYNKLDITFDFGDLVLDPVSFEVVGT